MQWLRSGSLVLPNETRTFETKTEAKRNGREEKKSHDAMADGQLRTDARGTTIGACTVFFFLFFYSLNRIADDGRAARCTRVAVENWKTRCFSQVHEYATGRRRRATGDEMHTCDGYHSRA